MSCYFQEAIDGTDEKLQAVLTFKREELLYDIENYAYIEGAVLPRETDPHNRHMVADAGQDGNVDRISRVLDVEFATMKEMLYPYTKHEIHNAELDNSLREPGTYGMILNVPADFSQTTLILLEKLIHEYLVCKAVADWMSITNPQKAPVWEKKAEEAETKLRENLLTRQGRVRRKLGPF